MVPRIWLSLLLLSVADTAQAAIELHVSTLGEAPESVAIRFDNGATPLGVEAPNGYITQAHLLPDAKRAHVFIAPSEAGREPRKIGEFPLPSKGRHLLLISYGVAAKPKTHVIPFDAEAQPKGGVSFLNLTSRKMRCFIDAEAVELDPGQVRLLPTSSTKRRIVNHRLELKAKEGWKADSSTTLILSANRRFLFILQEDNPQSPLRRSLVTDFDPERNLAPLEPASIKAEPPLPDPPAK
jgi:hypothetical protein